tara:strand:- start:684 stop:1052 length:369 start_codon:yes stop_codon:yes gene_type:complete
MKKCKKCGREVVQKLDDGSIVSQSCACKTTMPPERAVCLETAKALVCGERARQHGDAEVTYKLCADFWKAYKGIDFTVVDVLMMMDLMKTARQALNPKERDNYVDGCGYKALAFESITKEDK